MGSTNQFFDPGGSNAPPGQNNLYANRVKQRKYELLNRNVLEIIVEKKMKNSFVNINGDTVASACELIGLSPERDTEGYQVHFRGRYITLSVWAKPHVSLEKFISEETREVGEDLVVTQVRPAIRREVSALVCGLPFNVSDSQVKNYFESFGGKFVKEEAIYGVHKEGPWKNKYNGERRYKVDFSQQKLPMGTYHLIGGFKVRILYPGNLKTCGRCHKSPTSCVGGGVASVCAEREGVRVPLISHMQQLWSKIGFFPDCNEDADHTEEDDEETPVVAVSQETGQSLPSQDNVRQGEDTATQDQTEDIPETLQNENNANIFSEEFNESFRDPESQDSTLLEPKTSPKPNTPSTPLVTTGPAPSSSTPSQTASLTLDSPEEWPSIQDKVDRFETEDPKRKAEKSPELRKKEKKKLKNHEKSMRKSEIYEKSKLM